MGRVSGFGIGIGTGIGIGNERSGYIGGGEKKNRMLELWISRGRNVIAGVRSQR